MRWRSVMGGTGEACTREGPSEAREPKGRAFLQRSGREEPRRGGEKSATLGLRAAPATIGNPPCNRERGSHVDELMNRGMRTGVGGQRAKTRKRKQVERRHSRDGERLVGGWCGNDRALGLTVSRIDREE